MLKKDFIHRIIVHDILCVYDKDVVRRQVVFLEYQINYEN